jgi:hypothetical protein
MVFTSRHRTSGDWLHELKNQARKHALGMARNRFLAMLPGFKIEKTSTRSNGYENAENSRVNLGTKISTRYAFNNPRWWKYMNVCVLLDLMFVFVPFLTRASFMVRRIGIPGTRNAWKVPGWLGQPGQRSYNISTKQSRNWTASLTRMSKTSIRSRGRVSG